MTPTVTVLALAGSLREGSYNRALIEAARDAAPDGMHIELFDLAEIPLYDPDLDNDDDRPAPVGALKQGIAAADALLISTPEYNFGIPGVLKNAIDWASRPAGRSPMADKPTAIMSAVTGLWGGVRAQMALRDVLHATRTPVVQRPEVLVAQARQKFDDEGRLTDEATRGFVADLLANLLAMVEEQRRQAAAPAG